jgi:transposase
VVVRLNVSIDTPWKDLLLGHGSLATVPRRFQRWQELGVLSRMVEVLAEHVHLHGRLGHG